MANQSTQENLEREYIIYVMWSKNTVKFSILNNAIFEV
jgi:hypothetical protein